jgi:hypothetical protein
LLLSISAPQFDHGTNSGASLLQSAKGDRAQFVHKHIKRSTGVGIGLGLVHLNGVCSNTTPAPDHTCVLYFSMQMQVVLFFVLVLSSFALSLSTYVMFFKVVFFACVCLSLFFFVQGRKNFIDFVQNGWDLGSTTTTKRATFDDETDK